MQRVDYTRIRSHVFETLEGYNSPYQETKKMCVQNGYPFGIREEQMVSMKWSTKIGHSFRVLPEQPFRFIRCQTAVVLMGT